MTFTKLAFWFGFLELGFVLRGADVISAPVFMLWSSAGCVLLMLPQLRTWLGGNKA